jgi:hypothetical protein
MSGDLVVAFLGSHLDFEDEVKMMEVARMVVSLL